MPVLVTTRPQNGKISRCCKFHVIPFTGYGVIAEKPRVGHLGQILYEKLCGIENDWELFNDLDELYKLAKFVEDRTTCAGQCIPAGCSVTLPRRVLITIYVNNNNA